MGRSDSARLPASGAAPENAATGSAPQFDAPPFNTPQPEADLLPASTQQLLPERFPVQVDSNAFSEPDPEPVTPEEFPLPDGESD